MDTSIELLYLTNVQYNRTTNEDEQTNSEEITKEEYEFYKKRILFSIKEMFQGKHKKYTGNMKNAFDEYISCAVKHFKLQDKYDILQAEYKNLEDEANKTTQNNHPKESNHSKEMEHNDVQMLANNHFDRDAHMNPNKLTQNGFVKVIEPETKVIYPYKKEINLKDPKLKSKGIQKKNKFALLGKSEPKKEKKEKKSKKEKKKKKEKKLDEKKVS